MNCLVVMTLLTSHAFVVVVVVVVATDKFTIELESLRTLRDRLQSCVKRHGLTASRKY